MKKLILYIGFLFIFLLPSASYAAIRDVSLETKFRVEEYKFIILADPEDAGETVSIDVDNKSYSVNLSLVEGNYSKGEFVFQCSYDYNDYYVDEYTEDSFIQDFGYYIKPGEYNVKFTLNNEIKSLECTLEGVILEEILYEENIDKLKLKMKAQWVGVTVDDIAYVEVNKIKKGGNYDDYEILEYDYDFDNDFFEILIDYEDLSNIEGILLYIEGENKYVLKGLERKINPITIRSDYTVDEKGKANGVRLNLYSIYNLDEMNFKLYTNYGDALLDKGKENYLLSEGTASNVITFDINNEILKDLDGVKLEIYNKENELLEVIEEKFDFFILEVNNFAIEEKTEGNFNFNIDLFFSNINNEEYTMKLYYGDIVFYEGEIKEQIVPSVNWYDINGMEEISIDILKNNSVQKTIVYPCPSFVIISSINASSSGSEVQLEVFSANNIDYNKEIRYELYHNDNNLFIQKKTTTPEMVFYIDCTSDSFLDMNKIRIDVFVEDVKIASILKTVEVEFGPNLLHYIMYESNKNHVYAVVDVVDLGNNEVTNKYYCINSNPYMGGEEWVKIESDTTYFYIPSTVIAPRDGIQYLHVKVEYENSEGYPGEVYKIVDITNYKLWTGNDNSNKDDNINITYSAGKILISGMIYSNVPGSYKIETLNNTLEFDLLGDTVNTSGSYDSDGSCSCHQYYGDSNGYCNTFYCSHESWYYLDGEYHDSSQPCMHVPKGYKYEFSLVIDAKEAGISEGDLTSISYVISKRSDLTLEWEVKKEGAFSASLYIDLTAPTVAFYEFKGSGSKRCFAFTVADNKGLNSSGYYDLVADGNEESVKYERISLYDTYHYNHSSNYGGTQMSSGDTSGYAFLVLDIPENEIMQYKIMLRVYDTSGNCTEFTSDVFDCGDYTINVKYEIDTTGKLIKERVIETNDTSYTLTIPEVVVLDEVNYNKIATENWAEAYYEDMTTTALDTIGVTDIELKSFSSTNKVINVKVLLQDIKYKLYDYEEGDTLVIDETGSYSLGNINGNEIHPIGVKDGKFYYGYSQHYREDHWGGMWYGYRTGVAYYDILNGKKKHNRISSDVEKLSSGSPGTNFLEGKILAEPYEYAKAIQLQGTKSNRMVLLEDGTVYTLEPATLYDHDTQYYKHGATDIVKLIPGDYSYGNYYADKWQYGLAFDKNGNLVKAQGGIIAYDVKAAVSLDEDNLLILYNDGRLVYRVQDVKNNGNYYFSTDTEIETDGVVGVTEDYYIKYSDGKYEIYTLSSSTLIMSTTSEISSEDIYENYVKVGSDIYDISSTTKAKSVYLSDVEKISGGLFIKEDGTVYNGKTKVSGLSDIVAVVEYDGSYFASNSSEDVYAWGENDEYQLGLGHNNTVSTPKKMSGVTGIVKKANCYSWSNYNMMGSFLLMEDGQLYRGGRIVTEYYREKPVYGYQKIYEEDMTMKLYQEGIKDFYRVEGSTDNVTVLYESGEVKAMGYIVDGEDGTFPEETSRSDNPNYNWNFSLNDIQYLPNQYSGNIWVNFDYDQVDDNYGVGIYVYDEELNSYEGIRLDEDSSDESWAKYKQFVPIYENIPKEKLVDDRARMGEEIITTGLCIRADLEGKLGDIVDGVVLEKVLDDGTKRYGVINKSEVEGEFYNTKSNMRTDYKIIWFSIEERGGIEITFSTEDNAKTFEQGTVHLDYTIRIDEAADLYFTDLVDNLIVTNNDVTSSGAEKVLFRLQKANGDVMNLDLDENGKMRIGAGQYKLSMIIGGVNCFTALTTESNKYNIALDNVRFDVLRHDEWVHKSAVLGLRKEVEVIPFVDLT